MMNHQTTLSAFFPIIMAALAFAPAARCQMRANENLSDSVKQLQIEVDRLKQEVQTLKQNQAMQNMGSSTGASLNALVPTLPTPAMAAPAAASSSGRSISGIPTAVGGTNPNSAASLGLSPDQEQEMMKRLESMKKTLEEQQKNLKSVE